MEEVQKQTVTRNRREVEGWSRRMGERENEAKRREHAQRLKQLSVSDTIFHCLTHNMHTCRGAAYNSSSSVTLVFPVIV